MDGKSSNYVPPKYVPLEQSNEEVEIISSSTNQNGSTQWSSGICACCDDMQSSCYACGYRRALRLKYNLPETPCGDFITHFFCHLCAICQEYREIRERADDSGSHDLNLAVVNPPTIQIMESNAGQ